MLHRIILELSVLRLRQRRLLKLLRDEKILDWDGAIQANDPELKTIYEEILAGWHEDQENFSKNLGQGGQSP